MFGRTKVWPSISSVIFGAMTGRLTGMMPLLVEMTVSSLLVPVMDGFQQNA